MTKASWDRPGHLIQIARHVGAGSGVAGVAEALGREARLRGWLVEEITFDSLHPVLTRWFAHLPRTYQVAAEVGVFSFTGAMAAYRVKRSHPGAVTISHNESLVGDIYVNHGIHRLAWRKMSRRYAKSLKNPLHFFLLLRERLRFALGCHEVVVNFSKYGEEELLSTYKIRSRLAIIPNGVLLPDEVSGTRERGIPEGTFPWSAKILLFVGHEYDRKGLSLILEALCSSPEEYVLVVCGGTSKMVERAKNDVAAMSLDGRVYFMGQVPNAAIPYNSAACLILASSQEAWPLVILEAMAHGKPAITTGVSSIPEVVQHGVTGVIVERSARALSEGIEYFDRNLYASAAVREACLSNAARYQWASIAERYLDLASGLQVRGSLKGRGIEK